MASDEAPSDEAILHALHFVALLQVCLSITTSVAGIEQRGDVLSLTRPPDLQAPCTRDIAHIRTDRRRVGRSRDKRPGARRRGQVDAAATRAMACARATTDASR